MKNWFTDLFEWLFECEKIFGLDNLKETQFNIYPNPSNGYLKIEFNQKENMACICPYCKTNTKLILKENLIIGNTD